MSKGTIANALRYYREKNNISVKTVSEKFGKSIKTIYAWETGQGQPDGDTLIELCKLYGITSFSVLTENVFSSNKHSPVFSEAERQMLENFNDLNEQGRGKILEYSNDLIETGKYKKNAPYAVDNKKLA